jgi:hypothetical protein
LGAVAYGLTAASELAWLHPVVLGSLLGGVLLLAIFLRHEARTQSPMLPLNLFGSKSFAGANAITFLLYFALSGSLFFLPFNLIEIQGYSATLAGAAFLPFTLIMGGLSRWSGGLINRYGPRPPLTVGPLVVALGFVLLTVPGIGGTYWTAFFPPMVVLGLGMATSVAPLTTTVMSSVEDRHAGTASGINNAVARLAGMFAVALLGAVAVGAFRVALERKLAALHVSPSLMLAVKEQASKLAEARVPQSVAGPQQEAVAHALAGAFVDTFRAMMLIASVLALLSALCARLTLEPGRPGSGPRPRRA